MGRGLLLGDSGRRNSWFLIRRPPHPSSSCHVPSPFPSHLFHSAAPRQTRLQLASAPAQPPPQASHPGCGRRHPPPGDRGFCLRCPPRPKPQTGRGQRPGPLLRSRGSVGLEVPLERWGSGRGRGDRKGGPRQPGQGAGRRDRGGADSWAGCVRAGVRRFASRLRSPSTAPNPAPPPPSPSCSRAAPPAGAQAGLPPSARAQRDPTAPAVSLHQTPECPGPGQKVR